VGKTSGLGDHFLAGGYDISGDVNSLSNVHGGPAPLDVTDITQSAHSRLGGLRDGGLEFVAYHDTTGSHVPLSALPRTDVIFTYLRDSTLGNPAACMVAKQIGYDPTRAADGALTYKVQADANGYGLEWGLQLTAALRTDTTATNGSSIDTSGSLSFGAQAYLQVTAFSGTDVTVKIQDSADNSSFSDVTSFAFAQTTAAHTAQRIALANNATVRRYLRASTVTSAGFTSVTFSVVVVKNAIAGQVF